MYTVKFIAKEIKKNKNLEIFLEETKNKFKYELSTIFTLVGIVTFAYGLTKVTEKEEIPFILKKYTNFLEWKPFDITKFKNFIPMERTDLFLEQFKIKIHRGPIYIPDIDAARRVLERRKIDIMKVVGFIMKLIDKIEREEEYKKLNIVGKCFQTIKNMFDF
jgi:hypothetical protein